MAMLHNQMVNPLDSQKNVSLASLRRISKILLIFTSFDPDLRHVSSSLLEVEPPSDDSQWLGPLLCFSAPRVSMTFEPLQLLFVNTEL